jgi:hypothetical protein
MSLWNTLFLGSASISLADRYVKVKVHCTKISKLPVDVAVEFSVPRICQHFFGHHTGHLAKTR